MAWCWNSLTNDYPDLWESAQLDQEKFMKFFLKITAVFTLAVSCFYCFLNHKNDMKDKYIIMFPPKIQLIPNYPCGVETGIFPDK